MRGFGAEARELSRFQGASQGAAATSVKMGAATGRLEALNRAAIYFRWAKLNGSCVEMVDCRVLSSLDLDPLKMARTFFVPNDQTTAAVVRNNRRSVSSRPAPPPHPGLHVLSRPVFAWCSRVCPNSRFSYFSILSVMLVGGRLVQAGKMQAPLLLSFVGFCFSLNFAMQGVNFTVADAKRGQSALERVFKVCVTCRSCLCSGGCAGGGVKIASTSPHWVVSTTVSW